MAVSVYCHGLIIVDMQRAKPQKAVKCITVYEQKQQNKEII